MRYKPWARPELDACPFYVKSPVDNFGMWAEYFKRRQPIHLDLGCGKGLFIAVKASQNPNVNYIAIDIKSEVLVLAKRNIESAYTILKQPIDNVCLMSYDIERIDNMISPLESVERIYVNFCNPWHKAMQQKKRLTHFRQLEKYKAFLQDRGEIWFKTDDDLLFIQSRTYFTTSGFDIVYETKDLHNSDFAENVTTEHEQMFTKMGIKTKFLIASYIKNR